MSQLEVNKAVRVLSQSKPMTYTVHVHLASGGVLEFQCDKLPTVSWSNDLRCEVLEGTKGGKDDYGNSTIMKWQDGNILLWEVNP